MTRILRNSLAAWRWVGLRYAMRYFMRCVVR